MPDELIVLVGLPASGKTQLMDGLLLKDPSVARYDDFLGVHKAVGERGLFALLRSLQGGRRVVCNDVFLCRRHDREVFTRCVGAVRPELRINWIFFANDSTACKANAVSAYEESKHTPDAERRYTDRLALIDLLTPQYDIPRDEQPVSVWRQTAKL